MRPTLHYKVSVHYYKDGQEIEPPEKETKLKKSKKERVLWVPVKPQYVPKGYNKLGHAMYHENASEYFTFNHQRST